MARRQGPTGSRGQPIVGWALLAAALVFNATCLAPELRIGRLPINDGVFHLAAAERLGESLAHREPFLDPWVSEWALGYPVWRSYQPLPHLLAAGVMRAAERFTSHAGAFAALQYVLLVTFPASVFAAARGLGFCPLAAGLAALLVLAPSGGGALGGYGLGYGSTTWRGIGLYSQLVALHVLAWSLALVARAVDEGRGRALAGASLALTALSHMVFGYAAFVSAAVLACVGPKSPLPRRLMRLAAVALPALLLLAWFVVPLSLVLHDVGHCRWEAAYKWDSFGADYILSALLAGRLLDFGRPPILSGFVLVGGLAAALAFRSRLPRRLLALAGLWLALFFGRVTWGRLLLLAAVPADLHLHRLQAVFELSASLLAAWGVVEAVRRLARYGRAPAAVAVLVVAVGLALLGVDRARFLGKNAAWGDANLAAFAREHGDLEAALADVRTILAERPGRVYAGGPMGWGAGFRVGSAPVYAFLTRAHLDQVSFLYHAMSVTSDVMPLRDEQNPAHDAIFGVRAVVAPAQMAVPAHLTRRGVHGRFAVYEASPEGYFAIVRVVARYTGPPGATYEPSEAWLRSPLPEGRAVIALSADAPVAKSLARGEPLPSLAESGGHPDGRVVSEAKAGEVYGARVYLAEPAYALAKLTWHPDLAAWVDGVRTPLLRVTPGFAAVPVAAGQHDVVVRYAPPPLKPLLLVAGLCAFFATAWATRAGKVDALEEAGAARLSPALARMSMASAIRALRRRRRRSPARVLRPSAVAPVLALVFAAGYVALGPGNFFSVDEVVVQETAQAVIRRGTLDVPAMNTAIPGVNGGYYAHRGPALSYVALPLVRIGIWLDDAVGSLAGGAAAGDAKGTLEHPLRWSGRLSVSAALAANGFVGGALVALLFLVGVRLTGNAKAALLMAVAAGVATQVAFESTHFFQHPLEALGLLLAFWFLSDRDPETLSRRLLFGGTSLAIAFLARPNSAPAAAVLATYGAVVAWTTLRPSDRRPARLAVIAGLLVLGPAIGVTASLYFNWLQFGSAFTFGYRMRAAAFALDPGSMWRCLAAYVVSPSLSVFLFSPPLLLAVLFWSESLRRWRLEVAALGGAAAAYVLLFSMYASWHAGLSYGPRFMLAPIVLIAVLTVPAFERWASGVWRRGTPLVTATVAAGLLIQALGLAVYVVVNQWYRERLGVGEAADLFVLSASPPWLHLRELLAGRNLAPWALRTLRQPGAALLVWIGLVSVVVAGARALVRWYRKPPDPGEAVADRYFPEAVVTALVGLVIVGFSLTRRLDAGPREHITSTLASARAAEEAGHAVIASEDYALVLGIDPARADAYYHLGVLQQEARRAAEAEALYARALTVDPGLEAARRGLESVRLASQAPTAARPPTTRADEQGRRGPEAAPEHLARGGELQRVLDQLTQESRQAPGDAAEHFYRVGKSLWDAGDKAAALQVWAAGAAALPREPSLHRNAGLSRYDLGDYAGAAQDLSRAVELAPDDSVAKTDLAWAYLKLGRLAEARSLSLEVLRVRPNDEAATAILARVEERRR